MASLFQITITHFSFVLLFHDGAQHELSSWISQPHWSRCSSCGTNQRLLYLAARSSGTDKGCAQFDH